MIVENGNQTPADNGAAGDDIGNIMGGMAGSDKPSTKPGDNAGDAGKGENASDNGKSGEVQHPAWMSQLTDDIKGDADKAGKLSKFEKLSDLANAYFEAEGKLGSTLVKPGENSTDEERKAFYKALGVPDAADKYSIEGEDAKMFREMAYKNNLTDEQAKAIYGTLKELGENALAQQKIAYEQQAKETQNALIAEYGKDYSKKIEMLKRGIANYGGEAVGAKLQAAGLLADKDVVKLFIQLGEESSEAGAQGKTSGKANSYKSIEDGGTLSFGGMFDKK